MIVITGYASLSSAIEAMKTGVADYLPKPFTDDELLSSITEALSHQKKASDVESGGQAEQKHHKLIPKGEVIRALKKPNGHYSILRRLADHPVGPSATVGCGGSHNWDCVVNADGSLSYSGPNSTQFLADYDDVTSGNGPVAHLVKVPGSTPGKSGAVTANSWVTCTTCHDQHNMQYFNTAASGPKVIKPTHFFVRGWYDPGNTTTSNSAAQFCRTCHGGE